MKRGRSWTRPSPALQHKGSSHTASNAAAIRNTLNIAVPWFHPTRGSLLDCIKNSTFGRSQTHPSQTFPANLIKPRSGPCINGCASDAFGNDCLNGGLVLWSIKQRHSASSNTSAHWTPPTEANDRDNSSKEVEKRYGLLGSDNKMDSSTSARDAGTPPGRRPRLCPTGSSLARASLMGSLLHQSAPSDARSPPCRGAAGERRIQRGAFSSRPAPAERRSPSLLFPPLALPGARGQRLAQAARGRA